MANKKEKLREFIQLLEAVYYNPNLNLKKETKEELVRVRLALDKKIRISYLAYQLYPFVYQEKLDNPSSMELEAFSNFLLKNRWRYYVGSVFGMAFINFR